jgi:hypothetical protein
MSHRKMNLARVAIAIRGAVASDPPRPCSPELPRSAWQRCEDLVRQVRRARQRGWHRAALDRESDLRYTLARVRAELEELNQQLGIAVEQVATSAEIYHDLVALGDEFNDWSYDRANRTLAVTTAPIELEGVYLGPFEIRLHWDRIRSGEADTYCVVALDPRPSATRDDVTHPHVRQEELCEGDGRQPIRRALAEGRLLDFFLIVSNLLRSYNAASPFVSLVDWFATSCADCDSLVDDEGRYTCSKCESSLCDECQRPCANCGDSFCSDCVGPCDDCDDHFCQSCLRRCGKCRALRCSGCLDDQERCNHCHEPILETTDPSTEVPTNGVGQVAVFT